MAEFTELEKKYEKIPQELKNMRRWVCYSNRVQEGKKVKLPVAPVEQNDGDLVFGAFGGDELGDPRGGE